MPTRILQTNFTRGELGPDMMGRSDVEQYYAGGEELTNVVVIPQGGVKRRAGGKFIDSPMRSIYTKLTPTGITAPEGGTTANANDEDLNTSLITTNNVSTTNPYVVVQYDLGADIDVSHVDICGVCLTVSGSGLNNFYVQGATAAAPGTWLTNPIPVDFGTTPVSERRGVGGAVRYLRFVKLTATDFGTNKVKLLEMMAFGTTTTISETKEVSFEYNKEQTYNLVFTDRNIAVYTADTFKVNIPAPMFTSARIGTMNWTQSADTAIFVHEDIPPCKLLRMGSDTAWSFVPVDFDAVPQYDYTPTSTNPAGTMTPSAVDGVVTLTASGTPFTSEAVDVGQIIDGGGGRARIIQFLTTSTVKAVVLIPFYSTAAITSGAWVYEGGFEDTWSTLKGWPKSTTFHDGRLWFGGSRSRPQTLWGSKVGLFFDFDLGQVYDDDAIDVTLDTDQVNQIVNIFSQRTLQVLTTGAEFATLQSDGVQITPLNIDIRRQTQEGSKAGIRPVEIDGGTIYVKRGGQGLIEFLFDDVQQAYSSSQLTVVSSHLIRNPVDMAVDKSHTDNDATLLYIINEDGTMTVGSILKSQKVIGFTEFETDGLYKSVAVSEDGVWVIVRRTVNGETVNMLEQFDENYLMDSSYILEGTIDQIAGITWLEGETVKIRVDGVNVPDDVVTGGMIQFPLSTNNVQFGLNFIPVVTDMPVEISTQTVRAQNFVGKKKRVSGTTLRVRDTSGIQINGDEVYAPDFTSDGNDEPLENYTGLIRVDGMTEYTETGQVTITQNEPNPFTLLAISKKVNF